MDALEYHKLKKGKIEIRSKMPMENSEDLSLAYTPGVAIPCKEIFKDKKKVYDYTFKGNSIAVVTDGSSVLGLGNLGPEGALPVMEGKALLFKKFANIDAIPICLNTQDAKEIIRAVELISPTFGGINLEDIAAPRCFEVENALKKSLDIPVMHDDQHGTAIVVLAALMNASKVVGKALNEMKIVISGAGAAGVAVTKILLNTGARNLVVLDSKGIINNNRKDLNSSKKEIALITKESCDKINGGLKEAIVSSDVFIGVSAPNIMNADMVKMMNKDAIIFALSNPDPEILPKDAKQGGVRIIATGRSDYPNQVNNALAFPGIFRGALNVDAVEINEEMKIAAAKSLASLVESPDEENIIPSIFDERVVEAVSRAVADAALRTNAVRK
ncbi:NAD-dependent malic enzyme [Candidatus Woesearchaeota archaeon]|nr:NAD-dependent malic enzyme [Candidatus Woesearchaeota archaeon]